MHAYNETEILAASIEALTQQGVKRVDAEGYTCVDRVVLELHPIDEQFTHA